VDIQLRATFSPAYPLADIFHPPYPPIASQSISRDMPLAQARATGSPTFSETAGVISIARIEQPPRFHLFLEGGLDSLPLRVSNEGLLRPRVARAQESI